VNVGQFYLIGSTTAAEGLLAAITVTPKRSVSCPGSLGVDAVESTIEFDLSILSAPGGVKLDLISVPGSLRYTPPTFLPYVVN
jgi:hypothetical protein